MNFSLRFLSRLVRASMLVLLMLGVAIKPMLGSLCEIHALNDALAGYVFDAGDPAADPLHQSDRDHASGAHGSVHEDDSSGAYADIVGVVILPIGRYAATVPATEPAAAVPRQHFTAPFRPPIA